jgi:hypothetical protein
MLISVNELLLLWTFFEIDGRAVSLADPARQPSLVQTLGTGLPFPFWPLGSPELSDSLLQDC